LISGYQWPLIIGSFAIIEIICGLPQRTFVLVEINCCGYDGD
jgi:hypothetical protein